MLRFRMRIPVLGIVLCAVAAVPGVALGTVAPAGQTRTSADVLGNHRVWGPAFPTALRQMPAWASIGEVEVVLHPTRLAGSRQFNEGEARRAATVLQDALHTDRTRADAAIDRWWGAVSPVCGAFTIRPRVGKLHVAIESVAAQCRLLAPVLTLDVLRRELGAPESIARRVMPGNDDRTEVWTLYEYASGAVSFVESNYGVRMNGGGRRIDRALLNPRKLTRAMEEARR